MIIDVSYHNGTIDWNKVKASGVKGAIIRCGYGDNIVSQDDKQFKRNADECVRLGIPFGIYLYSYAKNTTQAKSEAEHALRLAAPYKGKMSYPIYYDLEQPGTESVAVQNAIVFGDIIEKAGYWCGIYSGQYWWQKYLGNKLDRFTKWVARYSSQKPVGISGTYDIWQYSSDGKVNGISGKVDVNEVYRDFPKEIRGSSSSGEVRQVPGNPVNSFGLYYRSHVQTYGWLDWVHDGQVAGTTGQKKRLEAIQIDPRNTGLKIKAQAHIQGTGTVDYGYITKDTVIGTTGQNKRLEALMLEVEGLPSGKKLYIQMHFAKLGWAQKVVRYAGTFGLGQESQALKIWVE